MTAIDISANSWSGFIHGGRAPTLLLDVAHRMGGLRLPSNSGAVGCDAVTTPARLELTATSDSESERGAAREVIYGRIYPQG